MAHLLTTRLVTHRNAPRIQLIFEYDAGWTQRVKKIPGARWSRTLKSWHIPDNEENRRRCKISATVLPAPIIPEGKPTAGNRQLTTTVRPVKHITTKPILQHICANNQCQLQKYIDELRLKAYSVSTIQTYRNEFAQLLQLLGNVPVQELQPEHLRKYMLYCIDQGLSENTLHSRINALKFYYEQVLGREKFFFEIPRPKKPLQVPRILQKEEVVLLIRAIANVKQRTMIMLAYGCGLRVSEVVNIRVTDIDGHRRILYVRRAKGKKDRVASLSPALLIMLREYYKQYRPTTWLFEGQQQGSAYSTRSLEMIIQKAKEKAGIKKPGSMHMLRHSFATHLLDRGTDVVMIQKLQGHNNIHTTLRYLHVSNRDLLQVISPLEDIQGML